MKVCLITSSSPSANPRLVKEADALVDAGYDVHVVAAHRLPWASEADERLVPGKRWGYTFIDWRSERAPVLFWKTRARHYAARRIAALPVIGRSVLESAVDRIAPELTRAAMKIAADLYVAHNPGALPAAATAAHAHRALLGFDAEDFHSGEFPPSDRSAARRLMERLEARFVPRCDYVTAASPGIADSYASLSRNGRPATILNVFPRSARPTVYRPGGSQGALRLYWFSQTIGPDRGLEDIVRAIGRLPQGAVELHLRGRWHSGYQEALGTLRRESGLGPTAFTSHPPASSDDMVRLASTFDVGLATETTQTLNRRIAASNKVFTYVLAGIATLATRTPGQVQFAADLGAAAAFFEPGDVDGAAGHLKRWADDRSLLESSRATAWQLGDVRYNWDTEKHTYLTVIEKAFARHAHEAATGATARIGTLHV